MESAAMPSMAPQAAPASYPSAPATNPWQEALQGLLANTNATPSYQAPAAFWPATPSVAPLAPQAQPYSAPLSYQAAPSISAPPIYPSPLPAAYPSQAPMAPPQAQPEVAGPHGDQYLDVVSPQSLEVLSHFGAEAPAVLNHYACVVEDALIDQARQTLETRQAAGQIQEQLQNAQQVLLAAAEDNAAYHTILTDPKLLAQYVNDFFGPNGVYPVELPKDRLAAEVAYGESGAQLPAPRSGVQLPPAQSEPMAYERPQLDVPAPGTQSVYGSNDALSTFSQIFDRDPAAAADYLYRNMTPDAFRTRQLIAE